MGVSQNYGYLFGGPHNKDYSILGSILGSSYFGKLPYILIFVNGFLAANLEVQGLGLGGWGVGKV